MYICVCLCVSVSVCMLICVCVSVCVLSVCVCVLFKNKTIATIHSCKCSWENTASLLLKEKLWNMTFIFSLDSPLSHEATCHTVLYRIPGTYLYWQQGFILSFRFWLPDNTLGVSQPHTDAGITSATCWSLSACQSSYYLISDTVSFHHKCKGWVFDLMFQR